MISKPLEEMTRTELQDLAWQKERFINWARFAETIKLAPRVSADEVVYDIASGPGHFTDYVVSRDLYHKEQVHLADLSPLAIKQAVAKGYHAEVLDIEKSATSRPADVIFFLEALEHVEDAASAIQNLFASLKPGGKLIISTPNYGRLDMRLKGGHQKPTADAVWQTVGSSQMTISKLMQLLTKAGFEIEQSRHLFQLESLGRVWKKMLKPHIPGLKQRFPYPDYNYLHIRLFAPSIGSLILIRARKP